MATLRIKDETYQRLSQKAAAQNTSVEAFVQPVLDQLAGDGEPASSGVDNGHSSHVGLTGLKDLEMRS